MLEEGKFSRKGQVTIFVILAILIVGAILTYFLLRGPITENIPADIRPVYDYYLSCLEDNARQGISLLGEQGGYIETPDFEPGSAYAPFSSHLDFFGQGVPYWMYISGNNLLREQVPTKILMQEQLSDYVSERVDFCDFSSFEERGYDIYIDEGVVSSSIKDLNVDLVVNNLVTIYYGDQMVSLKDHKISVDSKLGKFYDLALNVYNYEKKDMFLEQYSLDVLSTYAPVTGTELTCQPMVFVDQEIQQNISQGLASNIPTIKLDGDYYSLSSEDRNYFVRDAGFKVDESLNFMYSPDWPTRIEIYGDRVASPVGLQEGLGMLGFCYVPYHLVYDISFPVLVQLYDGEELFQFPVSVIISKNQAREALPTTAGVSIESPVCEYKNQEVQVFTYDMNLDPVESRIQFRCLNSICDIGNTEFKNSGTSLVANFPQCVNGFIYASAEGYADAKYQISTNEESVANILMFKKFNISLDLGDVRKALVSFEGEDYSTSVVYPDTSSIELIEGDYNVTVFVYEDSLLKMPEVNDRMCVDVPEGGLAGLFGSTKERCYDINLPEMDIEFAVIGGGKTREYVIESQLKDSAELNINVPLFEVPTSMEALQENLQRVEEERIYIHFE